MTSELAKNRQQMSLFMNHPKPSSGLPPWKVAEKRRSSFDDAADLYPSLPYPTESCQQNRHMENRIIRDSMSSAKEKYNYMRERREKQKKHIYGNRIN